MLFDCYQRRRRRRRQLRRQLRRCLLPATVLPQEERTQYNSNDDSL
jgi:hypothetical protein